MYIVFFLIEIVYFAEDIQIPDKLMDFVELILDPETESRLIEQKRVPGENNVGMVAWRLTLYTPEYPEGRDIIVIANDITYLIGSFGPREDKVFGLASEISRALKIPRVSRVYQPHVAKKVTIVVPADLHSGQQWSSNWSSRGSEEFV